MSARDTRRLAERFIEALHRLERGGPSEVEPMTALFAEQAELTNPHVQHRGEPPRGHEGARRFWANYRAAFQEIESRFSAVTTNGEAAGLFWRSRGKNAQGQTVEYDGATLLVFDDADKIKHFHGYFDSRSLETPALNAAATASPQRGYG